VDHRGHVGVLIPGARPFPALASGAVSGVSTSAVSGVDGKFWEFLKFFHATNHAWSSRSSRSTTTTGRRSAGAPEGDRRLAKKLEPEFWDLARRPTRTAKKLIDGGMQLVECRRAMMADLRKRTAHDRPTS
jgi:hypothetical protein